MLSWTSGTTTSLMTPSNDRKITPCSPRHRGIHLAPRAFFHQQQRRTPSLSRPRLRARVLLANSRRHRSHRKGPRRMRDLPLFLRRTKRTAETTPPCFNRRSTNAGAFSSASQSLRDRFAPHPPNSTTPASAISSSTTRLLNLTSNKHTPPDHQSELLIGSVRGLDRER
jgi:hypothetical protein